MDWTSKTGNFTRRVVTFRTKDLEQRTEEHEPIEQVKGFLELFLTHLL